MMAVAGRNRTGVVKGATAPKACSGCMVRGSAAQHSAGGRGRDDRMNVWTMFYKPPSALFIFLMLNNNGTHPL